jgi:hypothetical protein
MTTIAGARDRGAASPAVRRNWVTATLVLASMIYSIDWTIAAVALPHMQGTFSTTQDQVSWVLTSYIVARLPRAALDVDDQPRQGSDRRGGYCW